MAEETKGYTVDDLDEYGTNEESVFDYLDNLRESCVTNMGAARPYVEAEFGMPSRLAEDLLSEWMTTFSERHPKD